MAQNAITKSSVPSSIHTVLLVYMLQSIMEKWKKVKQRYVNWSHTWQQVTLKIQHTDKRRLRPHEAALLWIQSNYEVTLMCVSANSFMMFWLKSPSIKKHLNKSSLSLLLCPVFFSFSKQQNCLNKTTAKVWGRDETVNLSWSPDTSKCTDCLCSSVPFSTWRRMYVIGIWS